jgi:myo-inositol-1-phosphate synthase
MNNKLGVLIVGFNGSVSTTAIIGAKAIAKNISPTYGLYTETLTSSVKDGQLDRYNQKPIKEVLGLVDFENLVFGGWDIDETDIYSCAKELGIAPLAVIEALSDELRELKAFPGVFSKEYIKNLDATYLAEGESLHDKAQKIRQNITEFKQRNNLTRVIVVNVASTEVYHNISEVHQSLESFEEGLRTNHSEIGPAQTYAYAALAEGCPYANFTPSVVEEIPALRELALSTNTPIAGKDGKTGQTLLKTAIAPIFRLKNLKVVGWFSTNILGNKDGLVLDEPGSLKSKIMTKSSVLDQILGYSPIHKVNINYYPPRGDDKEAWDNIDIDGMLGMPMQIKINFLCKDSILAAGSVLDLVKLLDYCKRIGEKGVQEQLSFFFKSPTTLEPGKQPIHDFFKQEGILKDWIRNKAYGVSYKN